MLLGCELIENLNGKELEWSLNYNIYILSAWCFILESSKYALPIEEIQSKTYALLMYFYTAK